MNDPLLIPAVLLRVFVNPIVNVFQKKLTLTHNPLLVNLATYGILAISSLVVLALHGLPVLPQGFWIYSLLGGIAGALGNGFIVKALETGDLSVLGPINAYKSVIGMLFAFLLIGELPNAWGLAGMALIIAGSYVVLSTGGEKFNLALLKKPAIRYRLAALVLTGIQAVFDKKIIQYSDLTLAFCSWSIFGFLFSLLFCTVVRLKPGKLANTDQRQVMLLLGAAVAWAMMTIATNYTFSHMPVSEALALFQLSILLSVYFGYSFFREKDIPKKILGSLVMIAGSVLIILMK